MKMSIKLGLYIVVTILEYVCNDASKRVLKLSKRRLLVFPKYFLWKIDNCDHYNDMETKLYLEDLKNIFASMCLQSLWLICIFVKHTVCKHVFQAFHIQLGLVIVAIVVSSDLHKRYLQSMSEQLQNLLWTIVASMFHDCYDYMETRH